MRPFLPAAAVLILLLSGVGRAADSPSQPPPSQPWYQQPAGPTPSVDGAGIATPWHADVAAVPVRDWSAQFIFGVPAGVRVQRTIGTGPNQPWLVEGFVGLEVILPAVGIGVRRRFEFVLDEKNSLLISPGVDAYLMYNWVFAAFGGDGGVTLLAADVDLLWQHHATKRWDGVLGLKVGAGPAYAGGGWGVLPVFGVFAGFYF